jgi:hypothetical protein
MSDVHAQALQYSTLLRRLYEVRDMAVPPSSQWHIPKGGEVTKALALFAGLFGSEANDRRIIPIVLKAVIAVQNKVTSEVLEMLAPRDVTRLTQCCLNGSVAVNARTRKVETEVPITGANVKKGMTRKVTTTQVQTPHVTTDPNCTSPEEQVAIAAINKELNNAPKHFGLWRTRTISHKNTITGEDMTTVDHGIPVPVSVLDLIQRAVDKVYDDAARASAIVTTRKHAVRVRALALQREKRDPSLTAVHFLEAANGIQFDGSVVDVLTSTWTGGASEIWSQYEHVLDQELAAAWRKAKSDCVPPTTAKRSSG